MNDLDRLELRVFELTGDLETADEAREMLRVAAAAGKINLATATVTLRETQE